MAMTHLDSDYGLNTLLCLSLQAVAAVMPVSRLLRPCLATFSVASLATSAVNHAANCGARSAAAGVAPGDHSAPGPGIFSMAACAARSVRSSLGSPGRGPGIARARARDHLRGDHSFLYHACRAHAFVVDLCRWGAFAAIVWHSYAAMSWHACVERSWATSCLRRATCLPSALGCRVRARVLVTNSADLIETLVRLRASREAAAPACVARSSLACAATSSEICVPSSSATPAAAATATATRRLSLSRPTTAQFHPQRLMHSAPHRDETR